MLLCHWNAPSRDNRPCSSHLWISIFWPFGEIVAYYNGAKSFKQLNRKFEQTLRHLANGYLHEQIRTREELPNAKSVDFSQELDKLLEEVCRIASIP